MGKKYCKRPSKYILDVTIVFELKPSTKLESRLCQILFKAARQTDTNKQPAYEDIVQDSSF